MKRFCFLIIILFTSHISKGQVEWKFFAVKKADKNYEIHLKATLDAPWHIYSQNSPKGGPLPTKIVFAKNPLVVLEGKIKEEGKDEFYHDATFDVDVYSFIESVEFVQTLKLKANAKTIINGTVEFMACTKEQCLTPQKIKFNVKLE